MQTLLLDWLALFWNITIILVLTLLILAPLWSPAFKVACCVAVVWAVCFMYVILATRSNAKLHRKDGKREIADANKRARGVHYILAAASVVLTVVGLKLTISPPMKAEADADPIAGMNVLQIQTNRRNLPDQKIRDMTFVFADGD